MVQKLNGFLSPNRFVPNDYEELTALELIGKQNNKINELVDVTNTLTDEGATKLTKEEYLKDMETRKLDSDGNFTGSWWGISKPTQTDIGLASVVEQLQDKSNRFVSITDYEYLVNDSNWNRAFEKAIEDLNEGGTIYIPKGVYHVDTIILKQGINLVGDGTHSTIIKSNKTIFEAETLVSGYVYRISIKHMQLVGNYENIAIDLKNSTHITIDDLLISNVHTGITGEDNWLVTISNVTINNTPATHWGVYGFKFNIGTSVTMTRCWCKRVNHAYDLGKLHYSTLNSCAVDTFSHFAYNGGYAITLNSCGAEDGQLVEGGFVFGSTYNSTFNSCECIRINHEEGVDKAYLFHIDSGVDGVQASAVINNFKLVSYEANTNFTTFKVNRSSRLVVNNGTYPTNHQTQVEYGDSLSSIYFCDSKNRYFTRDAKYVYNELYTNGRFSGGYKATQVGNERSNGYFLPDTFMAKNSYFLKTSGSAGSVKLLQTRITNGNFSFTINLDVIGQRVEGGYGRYRVAYTNYRGVWLSPMITKVEGVDLDIIIEHSSNVISFTSTHQYTNFFIDVTCSQRISTGQVEMKWL